MAHNKYLNKYTGKIELIALFANIFIWIGYAIEMILYHATYSFPNLVIHIVCLVIFSVTLILFAINKSRFYKINYLTITYVILINMILSQVFFQAFFDLTGFDRINFFSRNLYFELAFLGLLSFINKKGHIISQGVLLLFMITYEVFYLQDDFMMANAPLYYFALITFCGMMYLMASNFNKYVVRINDSNIKINNLLLNILPADVADELNKTGESAPQHFDNVTVLFTDFKGFTAISENLSPKELVAELHYCFSAFDQIIVKHGLEKIKTIGDAYMCVAGLKSTGENSSSNAMEAAIEIQEFMKTYNHKKLSQSKEIFEIRIGAHSGPVVAGIVGIKKFSYDIWGDTVNTAARMESSGEVGKINISSATYALIKNDFDCHSRGKIQAKNKGALEMYFVDGKK